MKKNIYLFVVLGSIAIAFGVLSYLTPNAIDDLMFRNSYLRYNYDFAKGEYSFSWSNLVQFASDVRQLDNGRLSNILCALVQVYMPRWLFSAISGILFAIMYWLMVKLAGVPKKDRAACILLLWIASLFLLPFRNYIMVCDYLLNYLYPSVMSMWLILLMVRLSRRKVTVVELLGIVIVAAITGWFHEGFSAPLCIGLAVWCIVRRFRMSWQWWIVAVVFGLVSLWVALAPGVLHRADFEYNKMNLLRVLVVFACCLPAVIILAFSLIWSSIRHKERMLIKQVLSDAAIIVCLSACISATILILMLNPAPRAAWPAELFALIVLTALVNQSRWYERFLNTTFTKIGLTTLYVLTVVFFVNTLRVADIFYKQHLDIERRLLSSDTGTVFYDILDSREGRNLNLRLVFREQWDACYEYYVLKEHPLYDGIDFAVVPTALQNYIEGNGRDIEGNAVLKEYGGALVGTPGDFHGGQSDWHSDEAYFNFVMKDGSYMERRACLRLRFTGTDGKKYMYVRPFEPIDACEVIKADYVGLL